MIGLRSGEFRCREQHLELFIMFLKSFPNSVCSVAEHIVLLREATATREYHCYGGVYLVCNNECVYMHSIIQS